MKDNLLQYYSNINYMDRLHRDDDSKISNDSIVFVESEGAIYTHGHRFGGFDSRIISSLFDSAILSMTISPSTTTVGDNKTFTITPSIVGYNFDYSFTITRQILGVDAQPVPLTIPQGATSITDTINVPQNATAIVYTYTVKQSDEDGGAQRSYQKTITVQNTEYIYYGSGTTSADATNRVAMKTATEFNLTVTHAGDYLLICVPSNKTVSKIEVGGFDATSNYTKTDATIDNKPYSFYKSNTQSDAVTYNIKVTINNQ